MELGYSTADVMTKNRGRKRFSQEELDMIRTMWKYKFRVRDIAEKYGVSYLRISEVIRGVNYKDKL